MTDKAYAVPLHEQLARVPRDARLIIDDADGMGTRFIPVGRMCHEAAEALRARLAQPEPAECDGGQCGIGGYCKECPKPLVKLKEMLEMQGRDGTWNYAPYSQGMFNGMEFMVALAEGRDPVFREAPERWLHTPPQREWQGLTDDELHALHYELKCAAMGVTSTLGMYRILERALKEKNNG